MMKHSEIMGTLVSALREVMDPELGINIIDLGLIYQLELNETDKRVSIELSLSTPSCPLGDIIMLNAKEAILSQLPDYEATVKLVWEPAWRVEFVNDEGKRALGIE